MANELAKVAQTALSTELADASKARDEFAADADAENTRRSYRAQVRAWIVWAERNGVQAFPANPSDVGLWLSARAKGGHARATIGVAVAAIKRLHKDKGVAFDASHPELDRTLDGIRRSASTARLVKQAKPITAAILEAILSTEARSTRDLRDAAIIAALYAFALRRSELAALDFARIDGGLGVIVFEGDICRVTLLHSKTEAKTKSLDIERVSNPLSFAALSAWLRSEHVQRGGPAFPSLDGAPPYLARINGSTVSRAVKRACCRHFVASGMTAVEAAELAAGYSGHSGRVGYVVAAVEAGASDAAIMLGTRHKSSEMIARYGETARQRAAAPNKLKGVGV